MVNKELLAMPPDWRLFHVRRSTGKRLFFEVPLRNSSMVFECLMRDPETFDNCDNEALRKIFLEFAIEVHYFGESFRVSVGHLN
jgi:hypothetical protein